MTELGMVLDTNFASRVDSSRCELGKTLASFRVRLERETIPRQNIGGIGGGGTHFVSNFMKTNWFFSGDSS